MLDPACGSGTFLLGAYQYLIDWHLKYYLEDGPEKWTKGKNTTIFQTARGEWRLTTKEKKRILLKSIYGVDIDRQAVEVTKLSLLLKVLEGENEETLKSLNLFGERALPSLEGNIKCGNSLIGPDFYEGRSGTLFGDEEEYRINAFDWKREFKDIIKKGGFECVIGNPPYVRQEMLREFKPYFKEKYKAYSGVADIYVYFIEKGLSLLKEKGMFGIICSNKWMRAGYGKSLRNLLKEKRIEQIIDFGDLPVFKNVSTYPCIVIVSQEKPQRFFHAAEIDSLSFVSLDSFLAGKMNEVDQKELENKTWSLQNLENSKIKEKLVKKGIPLKKYIDDKIYWGIKTGLNEAFVITEDIKLKLIKNDPYNIKLIKPFIRGRDVKRYKSNGNDRYLILIPKGWTRKNAGEIKDYWKWFKEHHPSLADYLLPFKDKAEKRFDKGEFWWELRACEYYEKFETPKIYYQEIAIRSSFAFDQSGLFLNNKCYLIPSKNFYFLGILNSNLVWYYLSQKVNKGRGGAFSMQAQYLNELPIRPIDFKNKDDVEDARPHGRTGYADAGPE